MKLFWLLFLVNLLVAGGLATIGLLGTAGDSYPMVRWLAVFAVALGAMGLVELTLCAWLCLFKWCLKRHD